MKNIVLFGLVMLLLFSGCDSKSFIQEEIEKANHCSDESDCALAGGKCPFGCYVYVNEGEVDRIKDLIEGYESKCVYGCVYCPGVECVEGRCVEVCE